MIWGVSPLFLETPKWKTEDGSLHSLGFSVSKSEHLDGERSPCFDVQSDEKNIHPVPRYWREEMPNSLAARKALL